MRIATLLAATVLAGAASGAARPAMALSCDGSYGFMGGSVMCEIAADGDYTITAWGAQGGAGGGGAQGGLGASASGVFTLTAGTVLNLYVGQAGSAGFMSFSSQPMIYGGGGGGGSFVSLDGSGALLLAAGGGGGASGTGVAGQDGLATTWDTAKAYLASTEGLGGLGASGGGGGGAGGAGAFSTSGFASGGGTAPSYGNGLGGVGSLQLQESQSCTPAGGTVPLPFFGAGGNGGRGGGGGAEYGGGGGGGYTGGSNVFDVVVTDWGAWSECTGDGIQFRARSVITAGPGGGGGSYVNDVSADGSDVLAGGARSGNGMISIALAQTVATPEPASVGLLAVGVLALGAARRRG